MTTTTDKPKPRTLSLADYSDEMLALDALAEMDGGEWTEEHEALANEMLGKLAAKIDNFIEYRATLLSRANAALEYARQIREKADRLTKQVEWLDRYALFALESSGRDKMQGTVFALRRQLSPATVTLDVLPTQLPEEFQRVIPEQREADKKALSAALKAGATIPGVRLTQSYHLRVA